MLRDESNDYRCALCDARHAMPSHGNQRAVIAAASGKPNERVISVDGREIRRCTLLHLVR